MVVTERKRLRRRVRAQGSATRSWAKLPGTRAWPPGLGGAPQARRGFPQGGGWRGCRWPSWPSRWAPAPSRAQLHLPGDAGGARVPRGQPCWGPGRGLQALGPRCLSVQATRCWPRERCPSAPVASRGGGESVIPDSRSAPPPSKLPLRRGRLGRICLGGGVIVEPLQEAPAWGQRAGHCGVAGSGDAAGPGLWAAGPRPGPEWGWAAGRPLRWGAAGSKEWVERRMGGMGEGRKGRL